MDLDQLQSVRDRERQTDRLQQLRESFYEDAADFVSDLRAERDEAAEGAADPFDSPRVNRLTDRIRTAEQTLEAIYEKRVGKVVKAATFAAADLPAEAEGMTREEADLFETLVEEIEANRAQVLDRLTGDRTDDPDESVGATSAGQGASVPDGTEEGVSAADVMGADDAGADDTEPRPPDARGGEAGRQHPAPSEEADETGDARGAGDDGENGSGSDGENGSGDANGAGGSAESDGPNPDAVDDGDAAGLPDGAGNGGGPASTDGPGNAPADGASASEDPDGDAEAGQDVERELVRITDDVGPILGVDEREYDLATDDVVTLPSANARPLVERGAAERLE